MSSAYSPPCPSPVPSITFNVMKCQIYEIKMVLEKKFCLQLTKMEKKGPFIYILSSTSHRLYQRMSNVV